jgi:tRNA(His) 5'-end guanylyltransferase
MLWALLVYYKEVFKFRAERTLYGIAANDVSEKLFGTFGFKLQRSALTRRDNCNLYEVRMNKKVWESMMRRVWDLSAICETRW